MGQCPRFSGMKRRQKESKNRSSLLKFANSLEKLDGKNANFDENLSEIGCGNWYHWSAKQTDDKHFTNPKES